MKRLNPVRKFALFGGLCIVALSLSLGLATGFFVERRLWESEWASMAETLRHELDEQNLAAYMADPQLRGLSAKYHEVSWHLLRMPEVVGIKVWDQQATVLWALDDRLTRKRFPENPEVQQALAGRVATVFKPWPTAVGEPDRREFTWLAGIYVPVRLRTSGEIVGAVEVDKRPEKLLRDIRRMQGLVWSITIAGGILLYVVLLPIVRHSYRAQLDLEARLQEQSHGLEVLVQERTAELAQETTAHRQAAEALGQRTGQLEAVRAVTAEITRELDLPTLLDLIIRRATELVGAVSGAIFLWDETSQCLIPRAWHGLGDWIEGVRLRLGEGATGTVAARREGLIVNDYRSSPYHSPLFVERTGITAVLAEPLLYRDQLVGVITINNEGSARFFTEQDREVLSLFAAQAAIAIENARLHEAARRELAERTQAQETLQALYRASLQIQEPLGLRDRLTRLLEAARDVLQLDRFIVLLPDAGGRRLQAVASLGAEEALEAIGVPIGPEGGGIAKAYLTHRTIVWDGQASVPEDLRLQPPYDQIEAFRSRVFAIVPLVVQGRAIGVLGVDRKQSRRPLDPVTVELLHLFATQAAVAIENARLHETTQRRAQQLATLNELTRTLTTTLDPQAVARETLAAIQVLIPGAVGRLWEQVGDGEVHRLVASIGLQAPEGGGTRLIRPGEAMLGIAIATRQPVSSPDVTCDPRYIHQAWAATEGLVSCLMLPLVHGAQVRGVLALYTRTPHTFTDEEVSLLQSFAAQAAIALENARMYSETQAREREATRLSTGLTLLHQASRALHRTLDVDAMLTGTLDELAQAFGAGAALVHVFSDEGVARSVGHWLSEAHGRAITYRPGGISERVRQTRAPLVLRDIGEARDLVHPAHFVHGVKSLAAFPIVGQQPEVLGVLFLYYTTPQEFPESELHLLATYADHLAIALENARLYAASEARAVELATLREIGQAITARLDLAVVLEALVAGAMRLLDNPFAQIILWDEATQTLRFGAAQGPEADRVRAQTFALGRGINGTVALTRQPMILDDYQTSPYAVPECADIVATITVPILFGDRLLGVLHSYTTERGRHFTPDDLRRFQLLAAQAAIAIENARLHQAVQDHAATLEVRVRERTAELEEALRVKSEFLGKMSHELRTPLNFILGFSDLLKRGTGGPITPKQAHYLDRIQGGGKRLLDLVTAILDIAQADSGTSRLDLEPIPLASLIQEALDRVAVQATQKGLTVTTALDPGVPSLVADREKLAQILANLVGNAVKFTPDGGQITVRARCVAGIADFKLQIADSPLTPASRPEGERGGEREGQSAIANLQSQIRGDFLEIAVTDTGIGIRPEDLEAIFGAFHQVDGSETRAYGGAGLGLTLVRQLVELHGGRVWAESTGLGQGARFVVRLPRLTAPHQKRILLVEDEAAIREDMGTTLSGAGYAVALAPDGQEALRQLAMAPPDLLVLDIVLPDMDGWEVLKHVRGREDIRTLPVLVFTGLDFVHADQALALGADEFLTKPVSARVLVETVVRLLARSAGTEGHRDRGTRGQGDKGRGGQMSLTV